MPRLVVAVLAFLFASHSFSLSAAAQDRVVIKPRTVVIVRRGKLIRDFPEKRRATIKYPVVSGLNDPNALRRVQAIVAVKNVFDTSIAQYREDSWLEEFDYQVNNNQRYVLDITFTESGSGAYPDTQTKHFAINLKNGSVIKAADAFKADQMDALFALVRNKFRAELNQILVDLRESKSDAEDIRIAKEAQDALDFKLSDINDFSVTSKGVTFLYDAGYPHVIQAFEPEGRYFFTYAELKPFIKREGPLGQFIR